MFGLVRSGTGTERPRRIGSGRSLDNASDRERSDSQRLFGWHDRNGPASDIRAEIVSVDIATTIATVRLELDNWTGTNYTDLFTLLKVDGHWKIMNKVFHIRT